VQASARSWSDRLADWSERGVLVVLGAFLASRVALQIIGVTSRRVFWPFVKDHYVWRYHDNAWWDVWGVLDTGWYLRIVEQGYQLAPDPGALRMNHAFFPAYPLVSKLLTPLVGHPLVAGVLVSNLCFLGALFLLHSITRERLGASVAATVTLIAAFVPNSYVFSSMYTESLFLVLMLGCIHYAMKDRWLMVGLLGAALTATRLLGMVMFLPLGLLWVERHGWSSLKQARSWLRLSALGLIPGGLLLYMLFLHRLVGNALSFMQVQTGWDRVYQNPIVAILAPLWNPSTYNVYQSVYALICFAALVPLFRRKLWVELGLAIPLMLIPLFNGAPYAPLESYARYTVVVYPIFYGLALMVEGRPNARVMLIGALATVNAFQMVCWSTGMFFVM
jgi:hypothetical protein